MKIGQLIGRALGNNGSVTSNRSIIKDIRLKDIRPFMEWMQSKKSKYYKIAWSYLNNHHDIEDIFQNTIIKVYENIYQLREEKYFETWVTAIFINECKGLLRKRENIVDNIPRIEGAYEDPSPLEFKETIDQLEEIYREAIVLKYISGYSQEEIADILEIPVGTVKSRIYRGLKILRSNMIGR